MPGPGRGLESSIWDGDRQAKSEQDAHKFKKRPELGQEQQFCVCQDEIWLGYEAIEATLSWGFGR